jgi:pyruvate dehydrogenase kinase 2/3/4
MKPKNSYLLTPGGGLSTNTHVQNPSDLFSFSHVRNTGRLEDVRIGALRHAISSSKGIKGTVSEQVTELSLESSLDVRREVRERVVSLETPPRIGIGLPMSNIYAG